LTSALPLAALAISLAALPLAAGCASGVSETPTHRIAIVAAENFWGSITAQLAGDHAAVHSIIVNPAQDPHAYEPTAADARALATAKFVILNGVGYDGWASKLLAANPTSGRLTVDVGRLLGLSSGDNPHRWYDPADVRKVAATITADLIKLDPKQARYYMHRRAVFEHQNLAHYDGLITAIRARYAGVPVGASESIFALQAPALGLRLVTPDGFMKATSEGTEVAAQDAATAERQISRRLVKVWIYNSQNATPEVHRLTALARAHGIPVVSITETLSPPSYSFEHWQTVQLERIERALRRALGR
jgi:zinc/manganese transport system substrate-binding protein